jgi:hypothetical protein
LITTVLFTMAHGIWPWDSPALLLDRLVFGLVASYLVVRTGGPAVSIAAHAANNVVTFVFAALTNTVGSSLQATDAPWPLVAVDVAQIRPHRGNRDHDRPLARPREHDSQAYLVDGRPTAPLSIATSPLPRVPLLFAGMLIHRPDRG